MKDNTFYIISTALGLFSCALSLSVENWVAACMSAALFFLGIHCLIKENG